MIRKFLTTIILSMLVVSSVFAQNSILSWGGGSYGRAYYNQSSYGRGYYGRGYYNQGSYGRVYYGQGYCGVAYGYRGLGGINLSEEQLNEVNKILTPEQKELLNYYQQYGYYGKGYFRDVNGIRGLGRINLSEEQLNKINNILTSEQREQLNYCRLYR